MTDDPPLPGENPEFDEIVARAVKAMVDYDREHPEAPSEPVAADEVRRVIWRNLRRFGGRP